MSTIWECKVGILETMDLPGGADLPMRKAVEEAFLKLVGQYPKFTFSGWSAKLTESQMSVVLDED